MTPTPPTAELHVHIEGTLEPELIYRLAERNGVELPYDGIDDLRRRYAFDDLASFLALYYANMRVLRTAADFEDMAMAYLHRASSAGVRHAELFLDPQAHLDRGVPLTTVLEGLAAARGRGPAETGVSVELIACFLRDRPVGEAEAVLAELVALDAPIVGIGLDSAERDHPPEWFAPVYARARRHGLRLVAHAGEEGPAEYVRQAIDVLGVERIDHGVRCLEDDVLVDRLAAAGTPLTVCPFSNVRLRGVARLEEHPIATMLGRGLNVSVHSDDPAYFGGYVDDNLRALASSHGFGPDTLARLARNAMGASFVPDERRAALVAEVDAWEHAVTPHHPLRG